MSDFCEHGKLRPRCGCDAAARIAELRRWVKMAYFEGHADALCHFGAQIGWQNSEARAALEGK